MPTPAETITDSLGRKLLVQDISVLQQTKLLRAMGPMQAANQPYFNMVWIAAMVREIDGVPTRPINNERDIDSAIERLDDPGVLAVQAYMLTKMGESQKRLEDISDTMREAGKPDPGPLEQSASSSISSLSETPLT